MPKAKSSVARKKRHKKVLSMAKGFRGGRRRLFKSANETVMRALAFSYRDRRRRKGDFRRLWILRIGAAARSHGMKYSEFISGLEKNDVALNRKVLSQIAIFDPAAFEKLTQFAATVKA
ncbi:MAG: 50S ribosomal protein L20 [Candidatus Coatesbacteria bacterium]|nr:50S ribosomal protein L20 [Candidatus Coatesbacteria bacterium]